MPHESSKHDIECGLQSLTSQQGTQPTLGVIHHLEVIKTGVTYIPEGPAHSNLSSSHSLVPFLHLAAVRL